MSGTDSNVLADVKAPHGDNGSSRVSEEEIGAKKGANYTISQTEKGDAQIAEKKLTWQQATALLLCEYVVLAILAFPWSYSILGMAGGVITTVIIAVSTFFTTHILWRYCMKYPEIRDICDAVFIMTGRRRIGWWLAFIGLALNAWAIMGLHVVAGATAMQTIRGPGECRMVWAMVSFVVMFFISLIREMKHMSQIGLIASSTMFVCTMIVIIGAATQGTPNLYDLEETGPVHWSVWAPEGTTFVQGVNAILNIVYTFAGQSLVPSFVGDMAYPEDFPKALYLSMILETLLFTITGAVVYSHAGEAYTTAPAYGSLISRLGKAAAGMTLPTILIVGVLYSLITSRAIFFQIFKEGSIHRTQHTAKGWVTWFLVVLGGWIISFIIGEAVPFFSDLLSLISSLFASWFGFIIWGYGWYQLYRGERFKTTWRSVEAVLAAVMILAGLFFFGVGTYASIQSIINSYASGSIKAPFTCVFAGFTFSR